MEAPLIIRESFSNSVVLVFIISYMVTALILTAFYRNRPWSVILWFPVPVTSAIFAIIFAAATLEALQPVHGPGGGLEGLVIFYTVPGFLISAFVFICSCFARPSKEMFQATTLGLAISIYLLVCIGAEAGIYFARSEKWTVYVKDDSEAPMPFALVDVYSFAKGKTIATKRADSVGMIQMRMMEHFSVSIHREGNQARITGKVWVDRNNREQIEYAVYEWTSLIASWVIKNWVRQEMPDGSPRTITLYTAPNRSLPMNPVLRRLDKQFTESPLEAIRASAVVGLGGNFIALRHLDIIKAEYEKGHIRDPSIFDSLSDFLLQFKEAIVNLKNRDLAHSWPAQNAEDLHTIYLFLGQEEPDNQTPSLKLESLKKNIAGLRKELDQLAWAMRDRYRKTLRH